MSVIDIFQFIFGAIVGSFLNVVGLRYRTGLTLGGRSSCASCSAPLSWWQLIPLASFFILRGRCATCKTKISWQYPLIEFFTGLVFATIAPEFWLVFAIYIVILIYDMRHKIIPDGLVYTAIALSLLYRVSVTPQFTDIYAKLDWLAGPALFALFAFGWFISRGRALGFGDAKLVLSMGLLLGAPQGISAVVLAFWIGALVTVPLVLFGRKSLTMKSEIPFAPFLIFGAWGALLFNLDLFHLTFF